MTIPRLTAGMRELKWPSQRKGDFIQEAESETARAERDRKYRKRRLRCAMAELYVNFGIWMNAEGEMRALHLQSAVKAHAALKALGADRTFRLKDPG